MRSNTKLEASTMYTEITNVKVYVLLSGQTKRSKD